MRDVCVIGVGLSKWGEVWRQSLRQLFVDAAMNAIESSGVDHLDSLYVGCMSSGMFVQQEHISALCADYLGMAGVSATRVESACASGGISFRQAFLEVGSGVSDI
ncbi:MAG: thiolase domain-containing protein, partial [candidate division Zixibacteria bacterium]|nr:thiolase domain-containing protein [candidate division Zixibacteria bacterium]